MRTKRLSLWLLLSTLLGCGVSVQAADWNQWRGQKRDGHVEGLAAPAKWPSKLAQKWRKEVGIGHASPLIVGEKVFVFSREGENEVIRCLALANGQQVWENHYPAPYEMNPAAQGHGKGPKSTPVYADGRVYTLGISGVLSCLDASSGKVQWRLAFDKQYPKTSPLFGAAMSPIVDNGLLIAHVGGNDKGAMTAFDAKTGRVRWRWTGDGPGYSSPILLTISGVRQLVTQTQQFCVGIAVESGKLLWSVPFTTPYSQNSVTPVAAGDLIVFGGTQQPTFALRVQKNGAGWKAERVWETREATLYMSTPVASRQRLVGMSERRSGQLFVLDAQTGKMLWTGEGRFGDNAAVLDAGSVLLALATDGALSVYKQNGTALTRLARYQLSDSPTWASPGLSGNRLLIKDQTSLTLWEIPK